MGSLEFFPSFFFLFTFLPKNLPQNKVKIPIFCSSSIRRLNSSNFKFFFPKYNSPITLMTTAFRKNKTPHVFCFCFCLFVCFFFCLVCFLFVCLFCFALFAFCLFVCFYFFWGGGRGNYTLQISSLLHKINSCQCISMKLDVFRKVTLRTVVLYC